MQGLSSRAELSAPPPFARAPLRILHIVESLDNQAVESWLLTVFRAAVETHPHLHWTFFSVLDKEGRFDASARALGATVIHSRYPIGDKLRFLAALRDVMKQGSYDILHCHHDIMSAPYLLAAAGLQLQKRIVHVHNTSLSLPTPNSVKADLARVPMRQVCLRMSDQIVGISRDALESMIQNGKSDPERHRVVHYAVDTARFGTPAADSGEFRRTLGLEPGVTILLFVGRLTEYKNPRFVIEILEQLVKAGEDPVAVFAGTGDQQEALGDFAASKALAERVRFLGFRDDVPALMQASDLLIWPSLEVPKEGLGLGIVEAQAAGLPILMSRAVPEEAIVVAELVEVLPLSAGPKTWAEAACEMLRRALPTRKEALRRVAESSFSLEQGVQNLLALYEL